MTKWELFKALAAEHPLPRHYIDGAGAEHYGTLESIERKDGSGHSFNVRILLDREGKPETFHIRTTD